MTTMVDAQRRHATAQQASTIDNLLRMPEDQRMTRTVPLPRRPDRSLLVDYVRTFFISGDCHQYHTERDGEAVTIFAGMIDGQEVREPYLAIGYTPQRDAETDGATAQLTFYLYHPAIRLVDVEIFLDRLPTAPIYTSLQLVRP